MSFFVETRADGLPWTREGCNERRAGRFVPYPDAPTAFAAINARKDDRVQFPDPMWARADYQIVPAAREPVKMMPGQTPYTEAEQARLDRMIGAACEAGEVFGEDELEWAALVARRKRPTNGTSDTD